MSLQPGAFGTEAGLTGDSEDTVDRPMVVLLLREGVIWLDWTSTSTDLG